MSSHQAKGNRLIIGTPLVLSLIFCFAFVLMDGSSTSHQGSTVSAGSDLKVSKAPAQLAPLTLATKQELPTVVPDTGAGNSGLDSITDMTNTTSPQTAGTPQTTSNNHQGNDSSHKLLDSTRKLVDGLLNNN